MSDTVASPREALELALRYFVAKDQMNAATHGGGVRYSPITFRVAEALDPLAWPYSDDSDLADVIRVRGLYAEDRGRETEPERAEQ